jgi:hypothetical protein
MLLHKVRCAMDFSRCVISPPIFGCVLLLVGT